MRAQRSKSIRRLLVSLGIAAFAATPLAAVAKTVTLAMTVTLDEVAPEDLPMYRLGGHDLDRIAYDDTKVDPITHTAPITYLAHCIGGHWMPVEGLEASAYNTLTHRLQASASVRHGRDLTVLFDSSGRMAMLARPDFHMLIAGPYTIDPRPLTAVEIAQPAPGWNSPDTMPMLKGMAHMPGMPSEPGATPPKL